MPTVKVVEALGRQKRWQAAATGGLFMIALDAPYIIEGNLRHVVWWTWNPNFEYFQYWVDWPLVDLCWRGLWDALFLFIMLWALPRIDAAADNASRWSCAKSLGVFAPLAAVAVLVGGPILLMPMTIVTALGGPQWPLAALLVVAYAAIAVAALRTVVHEHGVTPYLVVQTVGVIVLTGIDLFPGTEHAAM
jgi:hypothetical protein